METKNIILYAEDSATVRERALEFFSDYFPNQDIEVFKDGTSLETRLKGNLENVCAVVTDNNMPGIDGLDIIKKHAKKINPPFILYSTVQEIVGALALRYGAYAYVQKSDPEKLEETLSQLINSAQPPQ